MVEIHQPERAPRLVAACVYPCEPGLIVQTNSYSVQRSRRITAELMLGGAFDSPEIRSLAKELGVKDVRFRLEQSDNCVLCGLCVRACNEIVGVSAISLIHRGLSKKVSTPFEISSSTCIGCGTCVLVCPTGRLKLDTVSGLRTTHRAASAYNRMYCQVCGDSDKDLQPYFVQEESIDNI